MKKIDLFISNIEKQKKKEKEAKSYYERVKKFKEKEKSYDL